MDAKTEQAFLKLGKALNSLELMLQKPVDPDRAIIDSVVQRFEFTFELFWKFFKKILYDQNIETSYPRDVLEKAYTAGLIDDEGVWVNILAARNQSSHTYSEELADKIYEDIKNYYPVMRRTYQDSAKRFHELTGYTISCGILTSTTSPI